MGKLLKLLTICCMFVFVIIQNVSAGSMGSQESTRNYLKNGEFTLQLGGFWRNAGAEQFIGIQDLIGDRFTVTNGSDFNGLFGVGYFLNAKNYARVNTALGLNWFYLPRTAVSGTVIQEDLFPNLLYQYNITNYPLYVVAKAMIDTLSPGRQITLNAGIGPNFMRMSRFSETSITQTLAFSSEPQAFFSSKTVTNFSATAGVGILLKHVFGDAPLACGYQFFYLGEGRFNIANDQLINTLKTGQMYANAAVCSIHI